MREWIGDMWLRLMLPLGVGLVLGLIGPFGTYDLLPLLPRLGYWIAVVSFNWLLADAGIRRVHVLSGDWLPAARISVPVLGAVVTSVPATGVVVLANGLSGIGWPSQALLLYGQVLLLLVVISVTVYAWQDRQEAQDPGKSAQRGDTASSSDQEQASGIALFLARLSRPVSGKLLCLEMQDHYLAVHTTAGTEMILCRMEDAARELAQIGRRVHRSWWVAQDAVERPARIGQRQVLRLVDGREVPVGKSYRTELKAAGWL